MDWITVTVVLTANTHTLRSGEHTRPCYSEGTDNYILCSSFSTLLCTFSSRFVIDNSAFGTNNFHERLHGGVQPLVARARTPVCLATPLLLSLFLLSSFPSTPPYLPLPLFPSLHPFSLLSLTGDVEALSPHRESSPGPPSGIGADAESAQEPQRLAACGRTSRISCELIGCVKWRSSNTSWHISVHQT